VEDDNPPWFAMAMIVSAIAFASLCFTGVMILLLELVGASYNPTVVYTIAISYMAINDVRKSYEKGDWKIWEKF